MTTATQTAEPGTRLRLLRLTLMSSAASLLAVALSLAPMTGHSAAAPALLGLPGGEPPLLIAHRGAVESAPENTLAALVAALDGPAEFVETDVRLTADGVPVLLHDAEVDRTTDGTGRVDELDYSELRRLDAGSWYAPEFAGERVPLLAEFLLALSRSDKRVVLELKGTWGTEDVAVVTELLRRYEVSDRVVFASFQVASLESAVRAAPSAPRMLLSLTADKKTLRGAEQVAATAIGVDWTSLVDPVSWFGQLEERGLVGLVFTVDDAPSWDRLGALTVYGVVTDRAPEYAGWRADFVPADDGTGGPSQPDSED